MAIENCNPTFTGNLSTGGNSLSGIFAPAKERQNNSHWSDKVKPAWKGNIDIGQWRIQIKRNSYKATYQLWNGKEYPKTIFKETQCRYYLYGLYSGSETKNDLIAIKILILNTWIYIVDSNNVIILHCFKTNAEQSKWKEIMPNTFEDHWTLNTYSSLSLGEVRVYTIIFLRYPIYSVCLSNPSEFSL